MVERLVSTQLQELFLHFVFSIATVEKSSFLEGKQSPNCAIPNASHVITKPNGQYHTGVTMNIERGTEPLCARTRAMCQLCRLSLP